MLNDDKATTQAAEVLCESVSVSSAATIGDDDIAFPNMETPEKVPVIGSMAIMKRKAHGTSSHPVQLNLRWGVDRAKADSICSFNRRFAENSGYFTRTNFLRKQRRKEKTIYYDSVSGKPLFVAPIGRTFKEFELESRKHGWPSFRDAEVVWKNVRQLPNGETVSVDGTHLGHNLRDSHGNRYCINLVCIAGRPNGKIPERRSDGTYPKPITIGRLEQGCCVVS
jgi:peptide methionine sulfoxide reductase MsrB